MSLSLHLRCSTSRARRNAAGSAPFTPSLPRPSPPSSLKPLTLPYKRPNKTSSMSDVRLCLLLRCPSSTSSACCDSRVGSAAS